MSPSAISRASLVGALGAFLGIGLAIALTPAKSAPGVKAVLLATGDDWGEVEPCG